MASVRAGRLTARVILVLVAALTAAWAMVMPAERAVAQAAWRVLGEGAADPPAFRMPIALSVDGSGSVYVVDQVYGFVMRVTSAGEYGGAWGRALNVQEIVKPRAVAVSVDGNVFVADHDARAVLQLSPDGTLLSSWEAGTASSLAFDHEGNLYVGYAGRSAELLTGMYHLQKLSPSGEQLGRWLLGTSGGGGSPSRGTASGATYQGVSSVAIDPTGRALFLQQRSTYSRDRSKEESHAYAELNVLDASSPSWSATVVSTRTVAGGEAGDAPARFTAPKGLAVDGAGHIFVADTDNNRVEELASDRTFMAQWGGAGSEAGQFNAPTGIAVDGQGRVYVADTGNQRIQILDASH